MKRTARIASATLLPLALAALASGCARDAAHARTASTPTFESRLPGSLDQVAPTADDDRGAATLAGPGVPGARYADANQEIGDDRAHEAAPQAAPGAVPQRVQRPQRVERPEPAQRPQRVDRSSIDEAPLTNGAPGPADQGRVCQAILQADLTVDDIPGGARVVLMPKAPEGYEALRIDASRLVREASVATPGSAPPSDCGLVELARKGVVATLAETSRGLELRFTVSEDMDEDVVREQVRRFVRSAGGKESNEDR